MNLAAAGASVLHWATSELVQLLHQTSCVPTPAGLLHHQWQRLLQPLSLLALTALQLKAVQPRLLHQASHLH